MKHKNTGSPRTVTGFLVVSQSGHCLVRYLVLPHGYLALYFCFSCFSSIKARFLFTFKFCSPVSAFRSYTHTPYGLSTDHDSNTLKQKRDNPKVKTPKHNLNNIVYTVKFCVIAQTSKWGKWKDHSQNAWHNLEEPHQKDKYSCI